MKKYLAFIAMFALALFLMPGALAALEITANSPVNAAHDSLISIPFTLANTHNTLSVENLTITITEIGNISHAIDVPISNVSKQSIAANSTTDYSIDNYDVPAYTSHGDYPVKITVSGSESNTSVSKINDITLTVSESKTWSVPSTLKITAKPNENGSSTFTITNTGNVNLTNIAISYDASDPDLKDSDDNKISLIFSPLSISTLAAGASRTITVTADIPNSIKAGNYDPIEINVTTDSLSDKTILLGVDVETMFCEYGEKNPGHLSIVIEEPDSGDDFHPNDIIPVQIKVKNYANEDLDVVVVVDLYDEDAGEFLDVGEEIAESIDEDKTEYFYVDLKVPADVSSSHDYKVYAKAYEDGEEDTRCNEETQNIDIKQESHDVIFDKITLPDFVSCSETFDITTTLANIGKHNEDDTKLEVYNTELGISDEKSFDIDEGDTRKITLSLTIPEDTSEKTYTLTFKAYYDYSSNKDKHMELKSTTKQIKVEGNCMTEESAATLSTEVITAEPKTGEQIRIKVTVFNTGDMETAYTLAVDGYEGWATLDKIEPLVLTLAKSKAGTSYIYLTPNENAASTQTLTVKALYGSKKTEKDISIEIAETVTAAAKYQGWVTRLKDLSGFDLATINAVLVVGIILVIVWIMRVRRAY